jgi:hypothetical protein
MGLGKALKLILTTLQIQGRWLDIVAAPSLSYLASQNYSRDKRESRFGGWKCGPWRKTDGSTRSLWRWRLSVCDLVTSPDDRREEPTLPDARKGNGFVCAMARLFAVTVSVACDSSPAYPG